MSKQNSSVDTPEQQSFYRQSAPSSLFKMSDRQIQSYAQIDHRNFIVATRIKPMNKSQQNVKIIVNKNYKQISIQSGKVSKNIYYGSKFKTFQMNAIFPQRINNENIFEDLVKEKLMLLTNNCNVSLMAYGATNSGKTYTIFGEQTDPDQKIKIKGNAGLAYLSCKYLIEQLFSSKCKFYFSYIQIYNQNIKDCLSVGNQKRPYLNIFQDHNGKINIPDLTKIQVLNYANLCQLISKGNKVRAESSNNINHLSSRSHAILQLDIFSIAENQATYQPINANFMIIDLAGSQKSSPYFQQSQQLTLKQGSNINKSLLALGNCIKNLQNRQNHIPYRDSKLTRILKQNISGNCQNILIACISQDINQYEQSINTLQYASKAYRIQTKTGPIKSSNRSQLIKIACQNCKMNVQYDYLCKILKQHHYQIRDLLEDDKLSHSLIIKDNKSTCPNYYLTIDHLKNQTNEGQSRSQQLILDNIKQFQSQVYMKNLTAYQRKLESQKQNININIKPVKVQNQKIHSHRVNKITFKLKQNNKRPSEILQNKPKLHTRIKQKISQRQQPKYKQFLKSTNKGTSTERLHQKQQTASHFFNKQQSSRDSRRLSLQVSSIKNNQGNTIILPFQGLNLDISQFYDIKDMNSIVQENLKKNLYNLNRQKNKLKVQPKEISVKIQNLNIQNIQKKKQDGSRTIRCSSNMQNKNCRQRLNSIQNKTTKRMQPDELNNYFQANSLTQAYPNYCQSLINKNKFIQNNYRSKIKISAQLR